MYGPNLAQDVNHFGKFQAFQAHTWCKVSPSYRKPPWPSSRSGGPTRSRSGGSSCAPMHFSVNLEELCLIYTWAKVAWLKLTLTQPLTTEVTKPIPPLLALLCPWTVLPVSSVTPSMTTTISNCELSSDCGVISKNGLSSSIWKNSTNGFLKRFDNFQDLKNSQL